jgi:hypothetical protein
MCLFGIRDQRLLNDDVYYPWKQKCTNKKMKINKLFKNVQPWGY